MTSKLGENIQHEWDKDPLADLLWDALQLLKQDRDAGIEALTQLAESGSALAMMYLGHAHIPDGDDPGDNDPADLALAEQWLIRSGESGSTEGRYQLAQYYRWQGNWDKALPELEGLAGQGFAPAMYVLGSSLYWGGECERSVTEAVRYLNMAKDAGNLPAVGLLSWIYRKEKYGLRGRLASHWLCAAKIPALMWYVVRYPNSDRLRGSQRLSAALGTS